MTSLKSGHRSRKPMNDLSISSQFPQRSRDGWVNSEGGPPSSSTNSERARDVMVERLVQPDAVVSSGRLKNGVRSTMDRSDLFSGNRRRPSSRDSRYVNRYVQPWLHRRNRVATLRTMIDDANVEREFFKRTCTPVQYMLTMFPMNILELDRTEVYTVR